MISQKYRQKDCIIDIKIKKMKIQGVDIHRNRTATNQATDLLHHMTKGALSEELGITRPTLDSRLSETSKWKILERKWISTLSRK